jgi:hypothetical protein
MFQALEFYHYMGEMDPAALLQSGRLLDYKAGVLTW